MQGVAVAVVEGEANEAAGEIALAQAAMHLVEADQVQIGTAQILDHAGEEARRDLKQAIGLEAVGPRRAHMVQGQDRADAARRKASSARYAPLK